MYLMNDIEKIKTFQLLKISDFIRTFINHSRFFLGGFDKSKTFYFFNSFYLYVSVPNLYYFVITSLISSVTPTKMAKGCAIVVGNVPHIISVSCMSYSVGLQKSLRAKIFFVKTLRYNFFSSC